MDDPTWKMFNTEFRDTYILKNLHQNVEFQLTRDELKELMSTIASFLYLEMQDFEDNPKYKKEIPKN